MSRLVVRSFAISIDGYGAGTEQKLERAKEAAGGQDVRVGGDVSTIRQYLIAGLLDELHFVLSPVLLGRGESLLEGIGLPAPGYQCAGHAAGSLAAAYVTLRKRS